MGRMSLLFAQIVSEERIRKAMREGQFDNLEGAGKPLPPDEAEHLPPELRMAYRILKSSGHLPAEVLEEREINRAIDMLEHLEDESERYRQMHKLDVMIMRMNERRKRPISLQDKDDYYPRIVEKMKLAEKKFGKGDSGRK